MVHCLNLAVFERDAFLLKDSVIVNKKDWESLFLIYRLMNVHFGHIAATSWPQKNGNHRLRKSD